MATRVRSPFVLILQGSLIVLLLYAAGITAYQVAGRVPPESIDAGNRAQPEKRDGRRGGSTTGTSGVSEMQDVKVKRLDRKIRVSFPLPELPICDIEGLPGVLSEKLKQYEAMPEKDKRQLEADMVKQVLDSRQGREVLKALDEFERSLDSMEPPILQDQ